MSIWARREQGKEIEAEVDVWLICDQLEKITFTREKKTLRELRKTLGVLHRLENFGQYCMSSRQIRMELDRWAIPTHKLLVFLSNVGMLTIAVTDCKIVYQEYWELTA